MSCPKLGGLGVRLPESVWLDYKDTLYRLYIVENNSLSRVKKIMEDEHEFPSQRLCDYEVALRDVLHFRKNLKREEWRAIGAHISNRKRQAKESEVIWNNTRLEPKKVRKELLRNSQPKPCRIRNLDSELPHGLVIRTPPRSPARCAAVVLPSVEPQLRNAPTNSPQADNGEIDHPTNSAPSAEVEICEVQRALIEAGEYGVSPYRMLRENLPFNRCMSQLSDLAQSHPIHLDIPSADTWTPVFPRLFGANPSWELFGQQIFQLSNKRLFHENLLEYAWFLKWIAISADFALLRSFFSINSPTAGAVYESLLGYAERLRMADLVRVLFELRHVLRPNNPMSVNEARFVRAAVQIGSPSGNSLDVVKTCLISMSSLSTTTHIDRRNWTGSSVLIAASRCDIAILGVLDAGWKVGQVLEFDRESSLGQIMSHIYNWPPEEEHVLTEYIELLIRGGVLDGNALPQCSDDSRPKVEIDAQYIGSITWDELVMMCPYIMRKTLQTTFTRLIGDEGTCISRAGVFTVAQDGVTGLRAYLEAHREADAFLTSVTLEECLLFAAIVDDPKTTSALLEVGVDPYVGRLSNNLEWYRKGKLPWNPSIVAAAAGHLEVLTLILSHIDLQSFLDFAPIHELVHHEMLRPRGPRAGMGRDLNRLKNLRQSYLIAETRNSNLPVECHLDGGRRKSLDTLNFFRSIAHYQGLGQKVDLEIIKAAVSRGNKTWVPGNKPHLPSEILLLKGLIETHLEYREEGMDLLHLSIRNQCSFAVVRFLTDKGLKVHSIPGGQDGNSMLHDALLGDSPDRSEIVEFLLKEGADCKYCGEGLTILEASVWNWHCTMGNNAEYQGVFERLLDAGSPVYHWERRRISSWRPLVSLLLDLGASDSLILRVVDAGASLNACGYGHMYFLQNVTPLQAALSHRRERLARELIRRGADVHAPASPHHGITALQAACLQDLSLNFVEHTVVVLGAKIDEPPASVHGYTSLVGAVCGSSLNMVEFLLDHGADVNAMCRFGAIIPDDSNTLARPLDVAVYFGSLDKVELLLKAGGRSRKAGLDGAIGIAARQGHSAVLSILRSWNYKHGYKILEKEALWQRQNPEQALMLSESTDGPYDSDTDYGDDDDSEEEQR